MCACARVCAWSLWLGIGCVTGYLLTVLGQAEKGHAWSVCVCVVLSRCFSRTERELGKTEKLQLIRAWRGRLLLIRTHTHTNMRFNARFCIPLHPPSFTPPLRVLLSLEALSFLVWDICLFPEAIQWHTGSQTWGGGVPLKVVYPRGTHTHTRTLALHPLQESIQYNLYPHTLHHLRCRSNLNPLPHMKKQITEWHEMLHRALWSGWTNTLTRTWFYA